MHAVWFTQQKYNENTFFLVYLDGKYLNTRCEINTVLKHTIQNLSYYTINKKSHI